jgi:MbtH protein
MAADEDDDRDYLVVVNDEEQYAIWLADRALPNGWRAVGEKGKKAACLKYIGEVWTDMRPKSLRDALTPGGS